MNPDLIFFGYQNAQVHGFQVSATTGSTQVIFTTAFDQCKLKAFGNETLLIPTLETTLQPEPF